MVGILAEMETNEEKDCRTGSVLLPVHNWLQRSDAYGYQEGHRGAVRQRACATMHERQHVEEAERPS